MISPADIHDARILIVDDQNANVGLLEQMLGRAGYRCLASTTNPLEVCGLHRANRYDLILLDLQMPGMDGFQVMEGLKEIEADGYVPVLVITAQPGHKLRALEAGAKDFVSKPFDVAEVLMRVHNMLEVRLLSRELIEVNRELEVKREEAERATRAKSGFLATMSHEIRTPLNAIIGMADVLAETTLTPEQKQCVDVFQRNGVALLNLINDILDLSKVESGSVELEKTDFDLREVIARALEVIEVRSAAKGLSLRWSIAPGIPVFRIGDPNRLRQVILNLLGNSIKFTEQGGLELRVEPDPEDNRPGYHRFAISDTGIGISGDKVDRIFENFVQADSSTTRKYGGTGLGLTISRQLVELMGGRIWVESKVGSGSTFFFTAGFLACKPINPREQRLKVTTETAKPLPSRLHLLLADDCADNRFLILSYLNQAQASIDIAENGEIAARVFRSGHYDLVLMDVEMPVMDGYAATRAIRRLTEQEISAPSPTPAVLALTAHAFASGYGRQESRGRLHRPPDQTDPQGHAPRGPCRSRSTHGKYFSLGPRTSSQQSPPDTFGPLVTGRIRVRVEAGMEDVVPSYLDKRRNDISRYRQALTDQDFDSIRMLGHRMKGTGAGYGFAELTSMGAEIEKSALTRNASAILATVDKLSRYINCVELEYPE